MNTGLAGVGRIVVMAVSGGVVVVIVGGFTALGGLIGVALGAPITLTLVGFFCGLAVGLNAVLRVLEDCRPTPTCERCGGPSRLRVCWDCMTDAEQTAAALRWVLKGMSPDDRRRVEEWLATGDAKRK